MKPYFIFFPQGTMHLPHIDYIMGGAQQCESGYTFGPAMRRYYIIEYVFKGKGEYTVAGQVYSVQSGQAFIIKPYEPHILRADSEDPWEYAWVGFNTDLTLPAVLKENYVFCAKEIADIFKKLIDGKHKERTDSDYAAAIFSIFARLYTLDKREVAGENDMIAQSLSIIQNEYATITVQNLAERFFVNRSYFGTKFKKKTGKTPKEYIDDIRLSAAAKMMNELGYTATQAAFATGYSDVMCFSKMYKKHFGKSPRNSIKTRTAHGGTIVLK